MTPKELRKLVADMRRNGHADWPDKAEAAAEAWEEERELLMTAKMYMPMPQGHMRGASEDELRDWWVGVAAIARRAVMDE